MKKRSVLAIITLVVFGSLLFVACQTDNEDNEQENLFKGTWVSNEGYTAIFEESSWHVVLYSGGVGLKGIYSYTNNTAAITYTEITDDGINWRSISFSEMSNYTNTATVSGNKLTWGATTYTRR